MEAWQDDSFESFEGGSGRADIGADAFEALTTHPFFRGLKKDVVLNLSKGCQRWVSTTVGEVAVHEKTTAEHSGDCLWVLTLGTVRVTESQEELGILEPGTVFGDSVAFWRCDQQPFTVTVHQGPVVAWCVPIHALEAVKSQVVALSQMEEFMDSQLRKLLSIRVLKLIMFSHCSANFVRQILKRTKVVHRRKADFLWKPATPLMSMEVVVAGKVIVQKTTATDLHVLRKPVVCQGAPTADLQGSEGKGANLLGDSFSKKQKGLTFEEPSRESEEPETAKAVKVVSLGSPSEEWGPIPSFSVTSEAEESSFSFRPSNDRPQHLESDVPAGSPSASEVEASSEESEAQYDEESEEEYHGDSDESAESGCEEELIEDDTYVLPATLARLDLEERSSCEAKAGPHCIVFGEAYSLGYQDSVSSIRRVAAVDDCIVFSISIDDFQDVKDRFPREKKRFGLLAHAEYAEWRRCGIHNLRAIDVFQKCSSGFLVDLAQAAQPQLCFHGTDIIAAREEINGLVLLMKGHADQITAEKRIKAQAPQSFGSLNWLNGEEQGEHPRVKAKEVCEVLRISHEILLDLLGRHPNEAGQMVTQAMRHNGRTTMGAGRATIAALRRNNTIGLPGNEPQKVSRWYDPFCDGLSTQFQEALNLRMECFKLVPGQQLIRTLEGDDADFLIVLKKGTIKAQVPAKAEHRASVIARQQAMQDVTAPCIICGFDRSCNMTASAKELSEIYRMTAGKCQEMAAVFPEDTRTFLERVSAFQDRLEQRRGYYWWSSLNVLRTHEPFSASGDNFLHQCLPLLQTRFFLPGEALVEEGDEVNTAFILESGDAIIEQQKGGGSGSSHDRTGEIKDSYLVGGIGGAYGLAGMKKRSATITARSVCKVIEVPIFEFLGLLEGNPTTREALREIAERRLKELAAERLEDHQFFSNFSKSFLNTVRTKCQAQVFFANEAIVRQGDPADSMVIIGADAAVSMVVDGKKIKDIYGGTTLGATCVISPAQVKRTATILTKSVCAVRRLKRKDWLEALKTHSEHRLWIQSFAEEQLAIAAQQGVEVARRRNWDKTKAREAAAKQAHYQRLRGSGYNPNPAQPFRRRMYTRFAGDQRPETAPGLTARKASALDDENGPVKWDCFNGRKATVPNTRLPMLCLRPPSDNEEASELQEEDGMGSRRHSRLSEVKNGSLDTAALERRSARLSGELRFHGSLLGEVPAARTCNRQMTHTTWLKCQEVFGMAAPPETMDVRRVATTT
eukprot:gb/GFBE01057887.1/.p1 GENE.gb/GFBE01057887.1/~~gb/GFBE01057887.1/.p1  ORF type:complete len:1246 (+),score=297.86 gb/GFBE01057887.1/:1-3738(+)